MAVDKKQISVCLDECRRHLTTELLPFWLNRAKDAKYGGFITHFDKDGKDAGTDEKSMLGQMRFIFSMSAAHRAGFGGGKCAEFARHGVDFVLDKPGTRRTAASTGCSTARAKSPSTRRSSTA